MLRQWSLFLRVLLRKIAGKVLIIWEGSPLHRPQAIKDFLKRGAARRVWLQQLPGYAPDLNPDEGVWNSLKRVELANVWCTISRLRNLNWIVESAESFSTETISSLASGKMTSGYTSHHPFFGMVAHNSDS